MPINPAVRTLAALAALVSIIAVALASTTIQAQP
jgi:hypothetical protein